MGSTGPRNLITDVAGLSVGHAHDEKLASGVTVVLADSAAVTAATIFGGGPGTRELDAIDLGGSVGAADAIVLSGGSAFGLDAASGVQSYLREAERGFSVGPVRIPIVPQAILFDLINGGDKVWGARSPYHELGFQAAASAGKEFALGSAGAGLGTMVSAGEGKLIRGGLGSTSEAVPGLASVDGTDVIVGALAAVNAVGSVTVADTPHFWAAPFEQGAESAALALRIHGRDMRRGQPSNLRRQSVPIRRSALWRPMPSSRTSNASGSRPWLGQAWHAPSFQFSPRSTEISFSPLRRAKRRSKTRKWPFPGSALWRRTA